MVAAVRFPTVAPLGVNVIENRVARMRVAPSHRALAWRNGGTGLALGNRFVTAFGIVGTVCRNLRDGARNLIQQPGQHLVVAPVCGGDFDADDVLLARIDRQVNFGARCDVCPLHAGALSIRLRRRS